MCFCQTPVVRERRIRRVLWLAWTNIPQDGEFAASLHLADESKVLNRSTPTCIQGSPACPRRVKAGQSGFQQHTALIAQSLTGFFISSFCAVDGAGVEPFNTPCLISLSSSPVWGRCVWQGVERFNNPVSCSNVQAARLSQLVPR